MEQGVRCLLVALVAGLGLMAGEVAQASVNLPLHHWAYEAIERIRYDGMQYRRDIGHRALKKSR